MKYLALLVINLSMLLDVNCQTLIDSAVMYSDSAYIEGELFTGLYKTDSFLYILNSEESIVFKSKYGILFEFDDVDTDGNKDIRIEYFTNVPGIQDLILYDPVTNSFIPVIGFNKYPDPKPILGTKYFYSYHRSGCADMNWDSDLFYIENYKTIKIGNIAGRECNNRDEKDGIYITKISAETRELINILPIAIINDYENYKWGFISDYWIKNYQTFVMP